MKKNTAKAGLQIKKGRKLTVGLDLGDRLSCYCILNESGDAILERKIPTAARALTDTFADMPRSRIALETGTYSPWISRLLSAQGDEVIVSNARDVRLMSESH